MDNLVRTNKFRLSINDQSSQNEQDISIKITHKSKHISDKLLHYATDKTVDYFAFIPTNYHYEFVG